MVEATIPAVTPATQDGGEKQVQANYQKFKMASPITYDSLEEERQGRKERLAAAYREYRRGSNALRLSLHEQLAGGRPLVRH